MSFLSWQQLWKRLRNLIFSSDKTEVILIVIPSDSLEH